MKSERYMGLDARTLSSRFVKNDTEQPTHPHCLVSHLLENIIPKLAKSKISLFYLVALSEQASFGHDLVGNTKDRFSCFSAHI